MREIFEAAFGWLYLLLFHIKPAINQIMQHPILRALSLPATILSAIGMAKFIWKHVINREP